MRETCEIIADIKDGKEVPYEELKMASLVCSSLVFFFQKDIAAILKGGISKEITVQMEYSDPKTSSKESGTPSWYWKAIKADPVEWLGKEHIPGTPEYEKRYKVSKAILNKVLKDEKNRGLAEVKHV